MMVFEHDFVKNPELTTKQLETLEILSPHQQIKEDFLAKVVKVTDGDTIRLRTDFRDFDFPLRLLDIDAPELNEGGEVARAWLENRILNKQVMILINKLNRTGKWGRILGRVLHNGMDVGQEMRYLGLVAPFGARDEGELPDLNKSFAIKKWL